MIPFGQFRFNVIRTVGEGGLGIVEEIRVTETNCTYQLGAAFARKRLNEKWTVQPAARERFEREIAAIGKMSHTSIIAFKGENLPGNERFYVMPLYRQSLRDFIKLHAKGTEWRSVARFGARIADAMQHAHVLGYIHRDLKPENILLDDAENPVISDWGLGYFVHRDSKVLDLTRGGMGTEYYCSLEQWRTGKCDERGDIYSLGVTLAELIRGSNRIPIVPGLGLEQDAVLRHASGSMELNLYLRRMTSVRPEGRPQSMSEVSAILFRIANDSIQAA